MPDHINLYEVNTRYWLYLLRQKYGEDITLGNVPQAELEQFQKWGFDWIWFMGVWDHTSLGEEFTRTHPGLLHEMDRALPGWSWDDLLGSPYAINEYKINPFLGNREDWISLRKRLADLGIKVMVDFVPNHYGVDTPLVREHPEYFIHIKQQPQQQRLFYKINEELWAAHGKDPNFDPWDDTLQVNYFHPSTHKYMIDVLLSIAEIADGVRCDMAMLLLNRIFHQTWGWFLDDTYPTPEQEFWDTAIMTVKEKFPNFVFNAEVYWKLEWELQQLGFDFTYDKVLYDRLVARTTPSVREHLTASVDYQRQMCRFIENHDERRAMKALGFNGSVAAAASILTLPGLALLHQGQLEGELIRIPVQLRNKKTEEENPYVQKAYTRLLEFSNNVAIKEGKWKLLDVDEAWGGNRSHKHILAWSWDHPKQSVVVVINNHIDTSQGKVKIDVEELPQIDDIELYDTYNQKSFDWNREALQEDGLYVELPGYQFHLFTVDK